MFIIKNRSDSLHKNYNNMKKLSYVFYLVLAVVILSSCENTLNKGTMIVEEVQVSRSSKECKYYIVTNEYDFYTDSLFNVGDTLVITNNR